MEISESVVKYFLKSIEFLISMSRYINSDGDKPKASSSSSASTVAITSTVRKIVKKTVVVSSQQRYSVDLSASVTRSGERRSLPAARPVINTFTSSGVQKSFSEARPVLDTFTRSGVQKSFSEARPVLNTFTRSRVQKSFSEASPVLNTFTRSGVQRSFSEARPALNTFTRSGVQRSEARPALNTFTRSAVLNSPSSGITNSRDVTTGTGRRFVPAARSAFGDPIHEYKYTASPKTPPFSNPTSSKNNTKPLSSKNYSNPISLNNPISYIPTQNNANTPLNNELDTECKVNVKKTGKFYDDPRTTKVPTYVTRSMHRGCVLLINNIDFEGNRRRDGADVDETRITELFKQMGFKIESHKNKTKDKMEKIVKIFAKSIDMKKVDICITVVMSHGEGTGGETHIETMCGGTVSTEWVVEQFSNSTYLIGKPKIFVFQCCRGSETEIRSDASFIQQPKARAHQDILICYATVPGFVSYRHPKYGAWYIQSMCRVFMEHAHDTHVEDLLKMIDKELFELPDKERQTSSYESRGFKICYFHPVL